MATGLLTRTAQMLIGNRSQAELSPRSQPSAFFKNVNGHLLAYDEYGDSAGYPLFYFHDAASSRLEAVFFHRAAQISGYRIIAIDRPGVGCSDYYVMEGMSDFCRDVLQLADLLGAKEFGLLSFGAGGVYATTLSHLNPERISVHLNLSGVPGTVFNEDASISRTAALVQELTPALVKLGVRLRHALLDEKPEQALARLASYLSHTDRKTLAMPRVRQMLAMDQEEAMRHGARGVAQDVAMCFRKLEFRLHEVEVSTQVWQGSADRWSSRFDCEYFVARLPDARFYRVPHRGHFFYVDCMDEIFGRLRASANARLHLAA